MTYLEKIEEVIIENFPKSKEDIAQTFISRYCPCEFFGKEAEARCGLLGSCGVCWQQEIKEAEESE